MEKNRTLILDTETTGLNVDDDKIIEIGIVELKDNILTQSHFHEYINPKKDISLSAQKVHGISNEFLIDKPTFSEIAKKFLDFIRNDTLIIHNAEFDVSFINKELQNCGFNDLQNSVIDTIKIAKKEFPGQAVNLDSLCRKLNIVNTRRNHHGALLDAALLSKVYLRLTTGKQEKLKLVNKREVNFVRDENRKFIEDHFLKPREHLMKVSNYEKTEHLNFINGMKDPIWKKI